MTTTTCQIQKHLVLSLRSQPVCSHLVPTYCTVLHAVHTLHHTPFTPPHVALISARLDRGSYPARLPDYQTARSVSLASPAPEHPSPCPIIPTCPHPKTKSLGHSTAYAYSGRAYVPCVF